jgi:RNA polymerase sigma-70 factor (ECF subfamily)
MIVVALRSMRYRHEPEDDGELKSKRLVQSFLSGDMNAFDRLIRMHQTRVFNLCYRFIGDYDDADDCAQEVFIKIHRSLGGFRFESNFSTWLYRVTVNTCKNRLKSLAYRLRSRRIRIDLARDPDIAARRAETSGNRSTPAIELIRKEIDLLIQKAVDALPVEQKTVVVLRDFDGISYEEIAEITGLPLGTVKSKLSRARLKLSEALRGKI